MKYLITFIIVFNALQISAQLTPIFETTIYFEDAIGNKDSIIYGYDTLANNTYNPDFGEIDIQTPFDSIFEVRVTPDVLNMIWGDGIRSKKLIAHTITLGGTWICDITGSNIGIEIYTKHPPVKAYWNSEDFNDICRINGYTTNVISGLYSVGIFETHDLEMACLWNQDTIQFNFAPFSDGIPTYFREDIIEGGLSDTIYGIEFGPSPMQSISPCWNWIVADDEVVIKEDLVRLFPNPSSHQVTIQSQNNQTHKAIIYALNGKEITAFTFVKETTVNTSKWPNGLYFVQIQDEYGQLIEVKKIVKK